MLRDARPYVQDKSCGRFCGAHDCEHVLASARPSTDSTYHLQLVAAIFVRPARVSDLLLVFPRLSSPVSQLVMGAASRF